MKAHRRALLGLAAVSSFHGASAQTPAAPAPRLRILQDALCFPLETQRVHLEGGNAAGASPTPPYPFGWIYLNLNTTVPGGVVNPTAQAWVETLLHADDGRFSVGFDAVQLDQANETFQGPMPGGVILNPPKNALSGAARGTYS